MVPKSSEVPVPANPALPPLVRRWALLGGVTIVSVVLDQLTKLWAVRSLRPIGIKTVIRGYFDLRYSLNTGAAWSFLADADPSFRRFFFLGATVVAMGFIGTMYHRAQPSQRALRWALSLLMGGAVGNLVDRLRSGQVIDFISLHLKDRFHWATFNVADIAITAGLLLLLFDILMGRKAKKSAEAVTAVAAEGSPRPRRRRRKK